MLGYSLCGRGGGQFFKDEGIDWEDYKILSTKILVAHDSIWTKEDLVE